MVSPQSNNVVCGFPLEYSVSLDTLLLFPNLKLTILKCSVFLLNVGKYPKCSSLITICYENMQTQSLGAYLRNTQHPHPCSQFFGHGSQNTLLLYECVMEFALPKHLQISTEVTFQ